MLQLQTYLQDLFFFQSAKSFLDMVHFYKSLSVELFRKKNPLVIFQSAKQTFMGTEIALPTSKNEGDDAATMLYLKWVVDKIAYELYI